MDYVRSFLPGSVTKELQGSIKKKKRNILPCLVQIDYCSKFRPLYDKKTFQTELQQTQGQLAQYFQKDDCQQYKSFVKTTKFITYGFWITCVSFSVFCHKIRFISRFLGQKSIKMISFKLASLVGPYLLMDKIIPDAQVEEINLIYSKVQNRYKRYKLTGDILQLNPSIDLFDLPTPQISHQMPI